MAVVKLFTFGSPRLERGGRPIELNLRKALALLVYLAVSGRSSSRDALATLLWPESDGRTGRARLRHTVHRLHEALGEQILDGSVEAIRLDPNAELWLDCAAFRQHVVAGLSAPRDRLAAERLVPLQAAIELYADDFLAGFTLPDSPVFDEWQFFQRESLRQLYGQVLEQLVQAYRASQAWHEAIVHARRWLALDPLHEPAHRALMRLYAWAGQPAAAMRQYQECVRLLDDELGATPEDETTALSEAIRTRQLSAPEPAERQPLVPPEPSEPPGDQRGRGELAGIAPPERPFVVPVPPTPLIGRGDELQVICAYARSVNGRALTITGAGGIGKTRLALEAAHALRDDFTDGVYLVELAALNDAALVASTIAQVLGVQERPPQPISATVRDNLRAKHLLLVLDNFEHVVTAAPLVAELLAACPRLTVLATSRAPLNIRSEQQFILEPLGDLEAVQLFVQRAQAAGASLPADESDATVYSAICRRLDRLPLAIELIAVRARTLAPLELLHELEKPLQALDRGLRDVSPRHQSLRNAIRWSYELLPSDGQLAFRRLGVFAGGCTAEAAQVVLGEGVAVLPVLEVLHQASLVQRQLVAEQTRFLMLETIREFALEQLERSGDDEITRAYHAEYVARFSMMAYEELLRAQAPHWRMRVAAELDNVRIAFGWALHNQAYETALRIATGVWRFHVWSGLVREGLERLEAALAYREQAPLEVQSSALRAAGNLARGLSDYHRTRRWLEAAVEAAWRLNDQNALLSALTSLGLALCEQGELEDARIHLEVSLELARRAKDPNVAKFSLGLLGNLHLRLGDHARAQSLSEECLRINQARQDIEGIANALRDLASIANLQGDTSRARQLTDEALVLHRSLEHQLGMGQDYALLGDIAHTQGDYTGALARYQQCLSLWRDRESPVNCALVFDSIAQVLSKMDDPARAVALMATAATIRERASVKLTQNEQAIREDTLRACRAALSETAFAAAWNAGHELTLGQAISLAQM
jgi:predicted ATPase/DNA-binding SARP family transcriptional activator